MKNTIVIKYKKSAVAKRMQIIPFGKFAEAIPYIKENSISLDDAILSGRNFYDVDFSGMSLKRVDFSESSFHNCKFDNADCSEANFTACRFDECMCRSTLFRLADLSYAGMWDTICSCANFDQTDLFESAFIATSLLHADFTSARNIVTTVFDNLIEAKLPENFVPLIAQ